MRFAKPLQIERPTELFTKQIALSDLDTVSFVTVR